MTKILQLIRAMKIIIRSNEYVLLGSLSTQVTTNPNGTIRYDGPIAFVSRSSRGFEVVCSQYMKEKTKDIGYIDLNRTMDPIEMMELFNQRMERSVN